MSSNGTVTDSDRLLARGVPITLADGETVRLRYGFRELKYLEDEFGSLKAVQSVFDSLMDADDDEVGKFFTPLCTFLYGGLLNLGQPQDHVLDRLDTARLQQYCEAVGRSFEQAFPEAPEGNGTGEPAETIGSPGTSSTGSPPSASAAQTNSSGE